MSIASHYKAPPRSEGDDKKQRRAREERLALAEAGVGDAADGSAGTALAATEAGGPTDLAHADAPSSAPSVVLPGKEPLHEIVSALAEKRAMRDELVAAVSQSDEWKAYDAEVSLEMHMTRLGYTMTDGVPMTAARRNQMQAHVRAVQLQLMQKHAEEAADKATANLSPQQLEYLTKVFGRLQSGGEQEGAKPWLDGDAMQELLEETRQLMAGLEDKEGGSGAAGDAAASAGATGDAAEAGATDGGSAAEGLSAPDVLDAVRALGSVLASKDAGPTPRPRRTRLTPDSPAPDHAGVAKARAAAAAAARPGEGDAQ